jgi:hypothetical protein
MVYCRPLGSQLKLIQSIELSEVGRGTFLNNGTENAEEFKARPCTSDRLGIRQADGLPLVGQAEGKPT